MCVQIKREAAFLVYSINFVIRKSSFVQNKGEAVFVIRKIYVRNKREAAF